MADRLTQEREFISYPGFEESMRSLDSRLAAQANDKMKRLKKLPDIAFLSMISQKKKAMCGLGCLNVTRNHRILYYFKDNLVVFVDVDTHAKTYCYGNRARQVTIAALAQNVKDFAADYRQQKACQQSNVNTRA